MSEKIGMMELRPWRQSGLLTSTRTCGDVGFSINGSFVDIWIRVNGGYTWFAVEAKELKGFLGECDLDSWQSHGKKKILRAESDGNAEEDMTGKPIDPRVNPGHEKRGGRSERRDRDARGIGGGDKR